MVASRVPGTGPCLVGSTYHYDNEGTISDD